MKRENLEIRFKIFIEKLKNEFHEILMLLVSGGYKLLTYVKYSDVLIGLASTGAAIFTLFWRWHETRFAVSPNIPFIIGRKNSGFEFKSFIRTLKHKGFEPYPFDVLKNFSIYIQDDLHFSTGELPELKEAKSEGPITTKKLKDLRKIGKSWILSIQQVLLSIEIIKRIFESEESPVKPVFHIGFRGIPVAYAFAFGYTLGVPTSIYIWHKPRNIDDFRLVYRFDNQKKQGKTKNNIEGMDELLEVKHLSCKENGNNNALVIIATKDNEGMFIEKSRANNSYIPSKPVRALCEKLFNDIIIFVIKEEKGKIYDYDVEKLEALIDSIASLIKNEVSINYTKFAVTMQGVEAGFAFALGAKIDKMPIMEYIFHFSVKNKFLVAIDVETLNKLRLKVI